MRNTLLAFLVLASSPLLLPAQTTGVFSNPTSSIMNDAIGYFPGNYPSKIEVTGMPARLHEFAVRFPIMLTGSFPDLDILLEAPNGQRILLTSDLPFPFFDSYDFGIGTTGKDSLGPASSPSNSRIFYPANYDDGAPDIFPSPGPGIVVQPAYPDPLALQDIDPNGEWKLYIVDDTPNGSSTWLLDGWRLEITAGDLPACKRPGKPVAVTEDYSATLDWTAGAGNTQWDLFVTGDLSFEPADSTAPTHPGLFQNQNVVVDSLEPGLLYAVFARADCGGGHTSPWVGPAVFKTTIHPCEKAAAVALCQDVEYPKLPYYKNFFFGGGYKTWVFAFTPPDSGDYWMQFENGGGYTPYYRLDSLNNCEDGQWTLMESDNSEGQGYRMPNLAGGQTCWIVLKDFNLAQQRFRIERCPFRRMGVFGVSSFTDSIIVDLEPIQNLDNSLDFYYGVKPLPAPDENTIPTLTGQSLSFSGSGTYVFRNLAPDTEYEFYVRRACANGDASCWQGPFSGKTAAVCSTIKSVHVDTTTYTWADVTFSFDSIPSAWEVVVCRPGKNPSHEIVGRWVNGAENDTITARILSIPLTEPLQLYFKAGCGGQSWQGPYDLPAGATPPLPVRDIFCGEETYSLPEEEQGQYISYINLADVPDWADFGERLFRYRANQTDTVAISFAGACGNCDKTAGCGFYYKPASQLPGLKDWKLIGYWKDILPPQTLKFSVEKDSVYYILCNTFYSPPGLGLTSFSFRISDCNITCPMADSISLESISPTSAVLRWNNAAPGGYYELSYFPVSGTRPPISVTTADTMLTLTGLLPASAYTFRIRSFCSPTDPSALRSVTLQLAKHTVVRESFLGRCNPRFLPPGETKPVTYDVFNLVVPESGEYRLTSYKLNTYLYDTSFDPENPAFNLLVSVKQAVSGPYQDTLVALQSGKTYKWVISTTPDYPFGLDFNHNGYDNIRILAAGPGPAQIGAAQWKGAEPKPHGKVPLQFIMNTFGAGACRDTSGWVHYYSWVDPPDVENDALLLSLKTGVDPEVLDDLPMAFYNYPPAAMLITNPPAEFVQNPDGFYEMNRFWGMLDLQPAQQIDQDFLIRFYYTQTDYELLKTAIEADGGKLDSHEAMYFHKINGFHDISNLDPFYRHIFVPGATAYDAEGYWQYANGPEATPSTWRHGTHAGEHYAEMVIRGFSGGGGGATVNGKSVFDPVSKTKELGVSRIFVLSHNPNGGVFSIELSAPAEPGVIFRITDPGGRLWREKAVPAGSKRETVQAGDLPAGLYFLQVVAEGKVLAAERFVKL